MTDFDWLLLSSNFLVIFLAVLLAVLAIRGNFTASLKYRKPKEDK